MNHKKSRNPGLLLSPSKSLFRTLEKEASANDQKSIIIEKIHIREKLLDRIRAFSSNGCCNEEDVMSLLSQLHNVSVSIVDSIIDMESALRPEREAKTDLNSLHPGRDKTDSVKFSWDGTNYLLKMLNDAQFICHFQSVLEIMGSKKALFRNPFILPLDIDEIVGYDTGVSIERTQNMIRVPWDVDINRVKRASRRILFEEYRGVHIYSDIVHITRKSDKGNDFIEFPVASVPEISWHDLDVCTKRSFDEAMVLCCVRLLIDDRINNEALDCHIPRHVVMRMNEIDHQDLARFFEVVTKTGKITILKQVAIAIYSTILRHILKMDLLQATIANHAILSLKQWLIMVMSKHEYLLTPLSIGENACVDQKEIPTAVINCTTDDNSGLQAKDSDCNLHSSPQGEGTTLHRASMKKYYLNSNDRAFLRDKVPMPVWCTFKVTEGEQNLEVVEGMCKGVLCPGDRIRIGNPFLSRLYTIDKYCGQEYENQDHIFIREEFDHTPVLFKQFIDRDEPVALLHNPNLKSRSISMNGRIVKPLIDSMILSTKSQDIYNTLKVETIEDREPLTFSAIKIWKLVPDHLDTRLEWRKEFDNGLVPWLQNLISYENCSIPCHFLRVRVDMALIEQDCKDYLVDLYSNVHQQRLQYFEKVSLNDIIMETFTSVCNWHPVGSSVDIFKWAKLARKMKFLSKVKNSNHEVDMAFLRHSRHRKLNLTQFRSILLNMATVKFPSSRYDINEALANMLWSTVSVMPPVNQMIWRKAQEMTMREEVYRVCAQTRIAARVRMQQYKLTYQSMRYAAIRIETHTRRMLSMQSRKRKLLLATYDRLYRIRYLSSIICQKYWRRYKRRRHFRLYKIQRHKMLMVARAKRRMKLQGKFRKKMQPVIYRKILHVQSILTITWMVLRDERHLQRGIQLEIQVYIPQSRRTHYFILSEQDIKQCLEIVILKRGPLSWEEMLQPSTLSQFATRLSAQMIEGHQVVNFHRTGIVEKGNLIENRFVHMSNKQYILSIYRCTSNIVIRLYDSQEDRHLRIRMDTPLLKAWLYDYSCYTKTGEIDFISAWELVRMKKKLEEVFGDDIELGQEESISEQDSGIPTLLEVSRQDDLVHWLMKMISVRSNSNDGKYIIILQFEKDAEKVHAICRKLQSVWRSKKARKIAKGEVYAQYEKNFDRSSQKYFYIHVRTGEKQWEKPRVLSAGDDVDEPPDEWRTEDHLDPETNIVQTYYFNPLTGQTSWLSEEDAARIVQRKFRKRQTQELLNSNLSFDKVVQAVRFSRDIESKYQENPTKLSNRVNFALLCHCLKFDSQTAQSLYKDAIQQSCCHPVIARAWGIFLLATCEIPRVQTLEKACRHFEDAEIADPGAKKFESARENFFFWSIVLHPNDPFALLNYALLHQCILGEYYRAEKIYRRALAQDPTNQNVVNNYNLFIDQCYPGGYYAGKGIGVPEVVVRRSHVKEERKEWGEWKVMLDPLCTNSFEKFWFNFIDYSSSFEEPDWDRAWMKRIERSRRLSASSKSLWVEYFDPQLNATFLFNRTTKKFVWKS